MQKVLGPTRILTFVLSSFIIFLTQACVQRNSGRPDSNQAGSTITSNETWLVNEDLDVSKVLQTQAGVDACKRVSDQVKRNKRLGNSKSVLESLPRRDIVLCGKHIFVYGTPVSSAAVPETFVKGAMEAWPEYAGPNFSSAGLIANPDDPGFPVGIPRVKAKNILTQIAALGATRLPASCALCHLGKLPDGRYSFGMSNDNIRFGALAKVFSYPIWIFDQQRKDLTRWNPELSKVFEKMKALADASPARGLKFPDLSVIPKDVPLTHFIQSLVSLPNVTLDDQRDFVADEAGRGAAFYIALGTQQRLILTIPSLWGITSPINGDLKLNRLGSFVHSPDLETHVKEALIILTGGKEYLGDEWVVPLAEFIRTFKRPENLAPTNSELFKKGEAVFKQNCASCHASGQAGSGMLIPARAMGLDERYTTPYIDRVNPTNETSKRNFTLIRELFTEQHPETDWSKSGVRVKRLAGVWARKRLMSNGSLAGLNHALCLENFSRRPNDKEPDLSELVHENLCALDEGDRRSLKEYLEHF